MHKKPVIIITLVLAAVITLIWKYYSNEVGQTGTSNKNIVNAGEPQKSGYQLKIIDRPVLITEYRKQLAREYSQMHYGEPMDKIIPQAIVIHWTASDNCQGVYSYFYAEEAERGREYGRLNLTSHFLVDTDGTVYRLTPETYMNRHAIGLNWCSIGIENIGGAGGKEDLTDAQLQANTHLVKYLKARYPSIKYLLGHYQQDHAREVGIWRENVPGYYAGKPDPGPTFMKSLIKNIEGSGLITF